MSDKTNQNPIAKENQKNALYPYRHFIGGAVGIYGLAQAIFQIPFGALSDKIGRKPIIILGLFIFCMGSLLAAFAHSITLLIVASAL